MPFVLRDEGVFVLTAVLKKDGDKGKEGKMPLPKRYDSQEVEHRLMAFWQERGIYHFDPVGEEQVFSIDTPPPTVSGNLHLGHVYSYSHPDFIARFQRMNGKRVFYPMGYDDNGLPTERLVEKRLGIHARQVGRKTFIEKCLQVSEQAEKDYQELWQRLGLSIDWRYTYRTIDTASRRISQLSFLELYRKGLVYRKEAPAIWCPECQTALAQADLNDLDRQSELYTLTFQLEDGSPLPIATTRPELLPACVAVFVHPDDPRWRHLTGKQTVVPLFGQSVPVLTDPGASPEKGTGVVMCCTFGDTIDVGWWTVHKLPLVEAIGRDGRMKDAAGRFKGHSVVEARKMITAELESEGFLLGREPLEQSVRVHERCDTPVEYVVAKQWFIRVLDFKEQLLKAGDEVDWHPRHMGARYRAWVENLNWDWCISRQRYFGVSFPVWYCQDCAEVILAEAERLPVNPLEDSPSGPCVCGGSDFIPEQDVLDTWATSSMSPQIIGGWLDDEQLYEQVFPFSIRPQAHEIIRTWAFYTIVKSLFHFDGIPWKEALISGWGVAGEGMGKISKSRGGGPMAPVQMLETYSADAVRYWTSSTGLGKDTIISEEKIQAGVRLVTKLWNVTRFSERFLHGWRPAEAVPELTPADRWILAALQRLVRRATDYFYVYDYAAARSEIEHFFWKNLADNYLEMSKQRLYDPDHAYHEGARHTLYHTLLGLLKLLAPFLPFVTEEIYQKLYLNGQMVGERDGFPVSIHLSAWPVLQPALDDEEAITNGELLVEIATAVRRFKSERNLPLSTELKRLQFATGKAGTARILRQAAADLGSVTRAANLEFTSRLDPELHCFKVNEVLEAGIQVGENDAA
jgi:valyl-tRNA synthetase